MTRENLIAQLTRLLEEHGHEGATVTVVKVGPRKHAAHIHAQVSPEALDQMRRSIASGGLPGVHRVELSAHRS